MTPTEVKAYAKALSDKIGNSVPEPSDWDLLLKAVQEMEAAPLKLPDNAWRGVPLWDRDISLCQDVALRQRANGGHR